MTGNNIAAEKQAKVQQAVKNVTVNQMLDAVRVQMNSLLNNMQKAGNVVPLEQQKAKMKEIVKNWYILVQQALIKNAAGEPNGFKADSTGILTFESDYGHPDNLKKWKHAHLVNELAREVAAEIESAENKQQGEKDSPINSVQFVKALESTDTNVEVELKDGTKANMNQETGDVEFTAKDGKKTMYRRVMDTSKKWKDRLIGWFMAAFNYTKDKVIGAFAFVASFVMPSKKVIEGEYAEVESESAAA